MLQPTRLAALLAATALVPVAAQAEAVLAGGDCSAGQCRVRLTAAELLASAESLVLDRRFEEAAPMLAALENAPQFAMQRHFLLGYSAVENGNVNEAIKQFRAALVNHPDQTRIRLELARALMLQGKRGAADHHFRLAQGDSELPPDLLAQIRATRSVLRDQRDWSFNLDLGFAPDSNITNGTNAETVDATFGNFTVPLTLDESARRKSGLGQSVGATSAVRFDVSEDTRLLVESSSQVLNYAGKSYDDIGLSLAAGPEIALNEDARLTVQATGSQRWYGGKRASTGGGARVGLQYTLGDTQRLGVTLDATRTDSGFAKAYDGWQFGGYATYERVIGRSLIGAATVFARRDSLKSASYSSTEFGANLGIGGELPLGISASLSGGVSRALNDAPLGLFGSIARSDWRFNGRATVGLRSLRMFGFSPSVTYSFNGVHSTLPLYDSKRHRVRFGFARYF